MSKIFINLICASLILFIFTQTSMKSNDLIPRKVLFTGEQKTVFKLSPDGSKIYFTSNKSSSVFETKTLKPSEIREIKLTEGVVYWEPVSSGVFTINNGSESKLKILKTNGEMVVNDSFDEAQSISFLSKNRKNCDILLLSVNSVNNNNSGIFAYNAKTNEAKKISELLPGITPFFDDDLNLVAANRNNQFQGISISIYNSEDKSWTDLINHTFAEDMFLGGFSKIISVSGDGKDVWFTSNYFSDKSKLYKYNVFNKIIDTIAENESADLIPMGASVGIDGNVTSVVGLYAETQRIVTQNEFKPDFEFLKSSIIGDISFGGQSLDGKIWLIREFTGGPANYYIYDRTAKKINYIMNDFSELDDFELAKRKAFVVKTRDGLNLPVHLYLPNGTDKNNDGIPDNPLPTILYVHGGPWVGVSHWNQYFHWRNFQLLANRGYAVINCEFRGATGYGKEHIAKSYKTWGSGMTNDKADIAEWAIKNNIADKAKVGIWGWSYGGYAAFAGAAFYPKLYACAVSMYGISDLESFGKIPFTNNDFWKVRVGDPYDSLDSKMLKEFSPINYTDRIEIPMLLTTGSKDDRIPQQQMDTMATLLSKTGKDVIYFYYPEEVHDYQNPQSWISFWAVTEQFLSTNLGGKFEKINNDLIDSDMVVVEGSKIIEKMN